MTPAHPESLLQPEDVEFFARELAAFVPDRVFDAHSHLWQHRLIPWSLPGREQLDAGYSEYIQLMQDLHPDRRMAALFIPAVSLDKKSALPKRMNGCPGRLRQIRIAAACSLSGQRTIRTGCARKCDV